MTQYRHSTSPMTVYRAHPFFRTGPKRAVLRIVNALALDGPTLTRAQLRTLTHIGESGTSRYVKLGVEMGLHEATRHTVTLRPDWKNVVERSSEAPS